MNLMRLHHLVTICMLKYFHFKLGHININMVPFLWGIAKIYGRSQTVLAKQGRNVPRQIFFYKAELHLEKLAQYTYMRKEL